MKLTAMIKLLPSEPQAKALELTLRLVNAACDYGSGVAWEDGVFARYALPRSSSQCSEDVPSGGCVPLARAASYEGRVRRGALILAGPRVGARMGSR
jgi:hypothetical protein